MASRGLFSCRRSVQLAANQRVKVADTDPRARGDRFFSRAHRARPGLPKTMRSNRPEATVSHHGGVSAATFNHCMMCWQCCREPPPCARLMWQVPIRCQCFWAKMELRVPHLSLRSITISLFFDRSLSLTPLPHSCPLTGWMIQPVPCTSTTRRHARAPPPAGLRRCSWQGAPQRYPFAGVRKRGRRLSKKGNSAEETAMVMALR